MEVLHSQMQVAAEKYAILHMRLFNAVRRAKPGLRRANRTPGQKPLIAIRAERTIMLTAPKLADAANILIDLHYQHECLVDCEVRSFQFSNALISTWQLPHKRELKMFDFDKSEYLEIKFDLIYPDKESDEIKNPWAVAQKIQSKGPSVMWRRPRPMSRMTA